MSEAELCARIAGSCAFNSAWYLAAHPDVAASGIDPVLHYVRFGRKEKRAVNPEFKLAAKDIFSLPEDSDSVNVVFAANDGYAPYLSVSIASLLANANPDTRYVINILHRGMSEQNLGMVTSMATDNVGIVAIDAGEHVREFVAKAYVSGHVSAETYFRFCIPLLFPHLSKCIYLDCDLVINEDISQLYNYKIDDKLAGVVEEFSTDSQFLDNRKTYTPKVKKYFNSGVMLINIAVFIEDDIFSRAIKCINSGTRFPYWDQDILNILCNGKTLLLPLAWNFMWQFFCREQYRTADKSICAEYMNYFANPAIVHYTSSLKPWKYDDGHFSAMFWRYARLSPWIDALVAACPYDLNPVWRQLEQMEQAQ